MELLNNKQTIRNEEDKKAIKSRINKIIGQLNGIKKMVDENKYSEDILIQITASKNALKSLCVFVLNNHLSSCIRDQVKEDHTAEEIIRLLRTFTKDQ